jgi:glycosyltransferase involved in cell wall biosynthesis
VNVTVALCTWNRAALLDQTLERFGALEIPPGVAWEVIVVDNNSSDGTAAVLRKHRDRLPLAPLFESRQGQSYARNTAIAAAKGELLLWTDDDVLVAQDWLAQYVDAAQKYPEAAYFGGPVEPWYESEPPSWLKRNLKQFGKVVAIIALGDADRPLGEGEHVIGANMAFRTEVLQQYRYDVRLSRTGARLAGCEDHEMTDRVRADGRHGMWVAGATVRHFIPKERTTLRFARQWWREQAQLFARRRPEAAPSGPRAPRWLLRKYWEASGRELLLRASRGSRWADAFFEAAWLRGLIDMCGPQAAGGPAAQVETAASAAPAASAAVVGE